MAGTPGWRAQWPQTPGSGSLPRLVLKSLHISGTGAGAGDRDFPKLLDLGLVEGQSDSDSWPAHTEALLKGTHCLVTTSQHASVRAPQIQQFPSMPPGLRKNPGRPFQYHLSLKTRGSSYNSPPPPPPPPPRSCPQQGADGQAPRAVFLGIGRPRGRWLLLFL